MVNTLFWQRSDNYLAHQDLCAQATDDALIAMLANRVIDQIEAGEIPGDQIYHLKYRDFVTDRVGAVQGIYDFFGIDMPEASLAAIRAYDEDNAAKRKGHAHKYEPHTPEEIARIRELYARYQQYYDVPSET
jgi:hypothetical protein